MNENPYQEDREQIKELLQQYENLRSGLAHSFIDEDSFEKIIDYYQENDDLGRAMDAAETATDQYPYSAQLIVKKADILLANRRYQDCLDLLDQAELYDHNDINI